MPSWMSCSGNYLSFTNLLITFPACLNLFIFLHHTRKLNLSPLMFFLESAWTVLLVILTYKNPFFSYVNWKVKGKGTELSGWFLLNLPLYSAHLVPLQTTQVNHFCVTFNLHIKVPPFIKEGKSFSQFSFSHIAGEAGFGQFLTFPNKANLKHV